MKPYLVLAVVVGLPLAAQVKVTQEADRIQIDVNGQPFTTFYVNGIPKPFLHPLRSASGKIVTRQYPMDKDVEGEAKDHPHHRGLWFSHGDVNGFDFWANENVPGKPKPAVIALKKVNGVKSGKSSGSVSATFEWQSPDGKALLTEERTMVFYSDPKERVIDFDIKLTPLEKVKFGDTKEGAFAIRLAHPLDEKHGGEMVSAEGRRTEKEVWGTRSPWVDYHGELDGEKLGIAILDHPSNPRHPTYWHSRAYGLFAANIWGVHDFDRDKTKDGSMSLQRGDSIRFRYRVIVHPGDEKSAGIAGAFERYSSVK